MGFASQFVNNLSNALAVVNILRSRLASDSDVEVQTDDAALENDAAPYSEVWTIAGVNSRPRDGRERADGTKPAGYAKAIRIQLGDVVYVLGTHDTREMEECAEGELVLHALGKDGTKRARAVFKPDGTVVVDRDKIELGEGAAKAVSREGDAVRVTVPIGTFLVAATDGVTNAVPVLIDGTIQAGSSKVKAVD